MSALLETIEIAEYKKAAHASDVLCLFSTIYPERSVSENKRMCFDENVPRHILTKLVYSEGILIAQSNVFHLEGVKEIANLGYHVHPLYQHRGIGYMLGQLMIENIVSREIRCLVVQIAGNNLPSIRLARKLNFITPDTLFLNKYRDKLKYHTFENGICLVRNL